jgi:hypothetical protein
VADGWPKPNWQAGVTGIPSDGVRDLPDISFFGSDGFLSNSAYLACISALGTCSYSTTSEPTAQEVGGTSVPTAAMAGIMALIDQKAGSIQGNPNAGLYSLAAKQTYSSCSTESVSASSSCYFNDIDKASIATPCDYGATEGNSSFPGIESPDCTLIHSADLIGISSGFSAETGYDQATGLGSMNVANVVNGWVAVQGTQSAKVTVTPAQTTLSSNISLSVAVTVAATASGGAMPSGSVTLSGGGYTSSAEMLSSGSYTFNIPANSLASGSDTLTVTYGGSAIFASTSGTATVTVYNPATSTFTLTATTPSAVSPGSTATSTLTVASTNDYVGSISLSCSLTSSPSGAQDLPTCSLANSPVSLSLTSTSATDTITISTTAATSAQLRQLEPSAKRHEGVGGGVYLALLIFLGAPLRWRRCRSMLFAMILLVALTGLSACKGFWDLPTNASGTSSNSNPGTTAGTYTFTISGTGSSPSFTANTTVSVTVN